MIRLCVAVVFVTALVVTVGCGEDGPVPAPTLGEAANATYTGIYEAPVTLIEGKYEGESFDEDGASRPRVVLVGDMHALGDLDGDGSIETVILLAENSGGSGSYLYLAVLGRRDGVVVNSGTARVGDRVQFRRLAIVDGRVVADVVQHGSDDAACCPSQKATRVWTLVGDGLAEGDARLTGTLSLKDLEGVTWALTHIGLDVPIVENLDVTLVVDGNSVMGSGGCNNYSAEVTETAPGELSVAAIAATRKMCADPVGETEYQFLKALRGAQKYSFLAGRLALTCRVDDEFLILLFDPHAAD